MHSVGNSSKTYCSSSDSHHLDSEDTRIAYSKNIMTHARQRSEVKYNSSCSSSCFDLDLIPPPVRSTAMFEKYSISSLIFFKTSSDNTQASSGLITGLPDFFSSVTACSSSQILVAPCGVAVIHRLIRFGSISSFSVSFLSLECSHFFLPAVPSAEPVD